MTLAYVFWHWSDGPAPSYGDRLVAFHRALGAHPPRGFRSSRSFAVSGARWLPRDAAFEDWYLIDDFAALGALNEAAISGARREPHDSVAALAAGGAGGLYALRAGDPGEVATAWWFSKPAGTTYETFFGRLFPLAKEPGAALWQRQMVLGPAPEFCLRSPQEAAPPPELQALAVACRPV
jgi:hypothetical protein